MLSIKQIESNKSKANNSIDIKIKNNESFEEKLSKFLKDSEEIQLDFKRSRDLERKKKKNKNNRKNKIR